VSSGAAIAFTLGPFLVALIIKGTGSYRKLMFWLTRMVEIAKSYERRDGHIDQSSLRNMG
jgi:hypothetical protein